MQQIQHPKTLLLLILFMGFSFCLRAQQVKNIEPEREGNKIIVKYTISGAKFNQKFDVSLYVSRDGGQTFKGPLEAVSGDVGEGIREGEHRIVWDVFKDVHSLEGDVVFDVKARVIEEKVPKEFMVSYMGSLDAPLGVTVGQLGKTGWYASFKTGTNTTKPEYTYGGETWNPGFSEAQYYQFNSTEDIRRLSITGGFTWQLGRNFFMYTGAGYGIKELHWQLDIYEYGGSSKTGEKYVKHPDYSYSGVEAEAGFILRMGSFLLEAGATTVNFNYTNVTLGAGLAF
jgi:hypothetical protein